MEEASKEKPPATVEVKSRPRGDSTVVSIPRSVKTAQITLSDVRGKYETAAETHILAAIEQKERERRLEEEASVSTETRKNILSGVPSNAVHLFNEVVKEDTGEAQKEESLRAKDIPFSPTTSAKPSLKDAASRITMMQKMAKMKSQRIVEDENENESGDFVDDSNRDPESQMDLSSEDYENNPRRKKHRGRKVKKFYRKYCRPCYSVTSFLKHRWDGIKYGLSWFFFLIVPFLGLAACLYYFAGDPQSKFGGSIAWYLILVARQCVTFLLAEVTQFILIDYIALETNIAVMAAGRFLTLMAVQAKGWPLLLIFWAAWNFGLLYGNHNNHWLSFQDEVALFTPFRNETLSDGVFNVVEGTIPGDTLTHPAYLKTLIAAIVVGSVVMAKRLFTALYLGKRTYLSFGSKLERMMQKVLLLGEVAILANEIGFAGGKLRKSQNKRMMGKQANQWLFDNYKSKKNQVEEEDEEELEEGMRVDEDLYQVQMSMDEEEDGKESGKKKKGFTSWMRKNPAESKEASNIHEQSNRELLSQLLGEWEEPQVSKKFSWKDTSIRKILQFREALAFLDGSYPLSAAFGPAETREQCMKSAQKIYKKLLKGDPDASVLHFNTLMPLATNRNGKLNKEKMRALIKLFRPDRDGNLSLLDFCRACDLRYRKVKTFNVSVNNAVQLDQALEKIVNFFFYIVIFIIVVSIFGGNPQAVFTGILSLFLPVSFLFSAAASSFFQGMLLVLVRQPYDIGDRIAVSNPMLDTNPDGSTTWFVEGINLFHTTVRNAGTNEVGTYANSALAPLRIINAARSPKAVVSIKLKFGLDVPYEKVKIFGTVVENFVKERPQEWIKMLGFRATVVEADLGYIGYVVIMNHVESWQNIGKIKQSLADVASFCLEVQKAMDMKYVSPPMPVNLSMAENNAMVGDFPPTDSEGGENQAGGGIQMIQNLFSPNKQPPPPSTMPSSSVLEKKTN